MLLEALGFMAALTAAGVGFTHVLALFNKLEAEAVAREGDPS